MATSWKTVIDSIRRKAPSCQRDVAVLYLQRTINELDRLDWLTRDRQIVPLQEDVEFYAIDADVVRIWDADLIYGSSQGDKLEQVSIRDLDQSGTLSNQIAESLDGRPGLSRSFIYLRPESDGDRRVGVFPIPSTDSINITNATNATPIIITTDIDHGLADSSQLTIAGVLGNLAANGTFFAKVTGYSSTTFALYSDSDLTTAVAGTGAYTASTGVMGSAARPFMRLDVSRKLTVTDAADAYVPESMDDNIDALEWGVLDKWFAGGRGTPDQRAEAKRMWRISKAELRRVSGGLLAQVRPQARPYMQQRYTPL